MEIYILDDLFRRVECVDRFESLIWTERFSSFGDFELVLYSSQEARDQFQTGLRIALNESFRVMTIESVEDDISSDGSRTLRVKGRSLELLLEDRVAKDTMANTTAEPKWKLTGYPADIARQIFRDICLLGQLDLKDKIANTFESSIFPVDTIAEPSTSISVELDPTTVYDAIKQLADVYHMGFRLIREYDTSKLYFNIFMGSDRTSKQTTYPPVVFSQDFDNLLNTTELTSTESEKNVAYVFSPVGSRVVYADGVDPLIQGFQRRVLLVNATDITNVVAGDANALMDQRGKAELAQNRAFTAFDGEVSQYSEYKYGTHYRLGDMVEMRTTEGHTNTMQVTEQIFVSDAEGDRSYPTLSVNLFITPGSWAAWDYAQTWFDLDSNTTLVWATAP
jgi:hypothetical protein